MTSMGLVTVRRLCRSAAHKTPQVFTHRKEILEDGQVRYTCAVCGEMTFFLEIVDEPKLDRSRSKQSTAELLGKADIRQSASAHAYAHLIIMNIGASELLGRAIIRHEGTPVELLSKGLIQHPGSAELLSEVDTGYSGSIEILGKFVIRPSRAELFPRGKKRRKSFTDQQFLDLYEKGMNDPMIAEALGVTKRSTGARRKKLKLKRLGAVRLFTDEMLIALHEEGLNDPEKAERLGVSEGAVFYRRRKLGLKPNRGRRNRPESIDNLNSLNFADKPDGEEDDGRR